MARAPLAISLLALLVASAAWWLRPAPMPCPCPPTRTADNPPAAVEPTTGRQQLAALQRRVATLEARLARADQVAPAAVEKPPAAETGLAAPPRDARIVAVRAPHTALAVTFGDGDAISVRNSDPALVGQRVFIEVETADGRTARRPITVPPAE